MRYLANGLVEYTQYGKEIKPAVAVFAVTSTVKELAQILRRHVLLNSPYHEPLMSIIDEWEAGHATNSG